MAPTDSGVAQDALPRLPKREPGPGALLPDLRHTYLEGDWGAARNLSERALAIAPQDVRALGLRGLLEYQVGDFGEGEAYLERLLEAMSLTVPGPNNQYAFPAMVIPTAACIAGLAHHLDVAEAAAKLVLSSPSATPLLANFARTGLALLAVLRRNMEAAVEQYTALKQGRGEMNPFTGMSSDRLLGLLAQTIGQPDMAAEHFEDALAFCRKAGYRPELAWTCCDYADCLLLQRPRAVADETAQPVRPEPVEGRGSTSSPRTEAQQQRQKAMALLDEALAISSELGMRPLMGRVLSRREILTA